MTIRIFRLSAVAPKLNAQSCKLKAVSSTLRATSNQLTAYSLLFILLCGCRAAAVSCSDPIGCIVVRPNEPIQIAALLPFSGAAQPMGQELVNGIELAIEAYEGALLEHPIELVRFDTACSAEIGRDAAQALLSNDQIVAVIGPACSTVASEVAPLIADAGGVMVSPAATAVNLLPTSRQSAAPALLRTIPDYTEQAQTAAQYARTYLSAGTAAIIYDDSTQSTAIQQRFVSVFEWLGGEIVSTVMLPEDPEALSQVLETTLDSRADLIYLPLNAAQANLVMNKFVELFAPDDLTLIGIDTMYSRSFPLQTGSAALGLYVTGTAVQGDGHSVFLGNWLAAYGTLPETHFPAFAYDAFNITASAITETAVVDSQGGLLIGKSALREALADTKGFDGLTGRLNCTSGGSCASNQSLDVFLFSESVIAGSQWPPPTAPRDALAP